MKTYQPYLLKDVHQAAEQKKFSVISTFAGGGGSSTGYKLAGGDILCINEFVPEAVDTYLANYPNTPVLDGDIRNLTGQDFLSASGLSVGELDILDGSPPCVAFSESGGNHKNWGKERKYSSTTLRNAEDLFMDFLGIVDELKPKVVIAENVRGIGYEYAKPYFNKIHTVFSELGYFCSAKLMDAAHFGVPQARLRYFFIATRKDLAKEKKIHKLTYPKKIFAKPDAEPTVVKDAFIGLDNIPEQMIQSDLLLAKMKKLTKYQYVKDFYPDTRQKMSSIHPNGSYWNTVRLIDNYPSWGLTQTGLKQSLQTFLHPRLDRGVTVFEAKRLMGLPDDYVLTGELDDQFERVGRMVAPLQMKANAQKVHEVILS